MRLIRWIHTDHDSVGVLIEGLVICLFHVIVFQSSGGGDSSAARGNLAEGRK